MAEESEDKTEQPTDRKIENARKEGQVAQSIEIRSWAGLMGAVVIIALIIPWMGSGLKRLMVPFIDHPHVFEVSPGGMGPVLADLTFGLMAQLMAPLLLMMLFGIVASVGQNGLLFVPKRLAFDLEKISPLKGFERLFSLNNLVDFLKSIFKVAIVGVVVFLVLKRKIDEYIGLAALDLAAILEYVRWEVLSLLFYAMLLVTVLAAADWFFQRWSHTKKMRMSKQEVKDEHKQTEGDPMVKGRLRSLRMQRARQRMMAAVPKADVVITNPTHYAVALKYDMDAMNAPVLVAKGADLVAKRIRDLAEEHKIPVVQNPPLARALYATVELDQEIPPEHYKAVAEVIGYVMKLRGHIAH